MAHSGSVKRAQAIKLCELCLEGCIKWRCIDCEKCLCEKCKSIHTRVPVTANHQIVTIATSLQDIPRKVVVDNILCKVHSSRITCMFCLICDSLVCTECISNKHLKHKFVPIETIVDRKLDKLRSVQVNIFDNLKYCDSQNIEIQNMKSQYHSIFEESMEKIQHQEKHLKDVIGKYSKTLQRQVEHKRLGTLNAISSAEQHIDRVRKVLEKQREEIENALKSTQGSIIFGKEPLMPTLNITFDSLPKEVEHFVPMEVKKGQIQEIFGSLHEIKVPIVGCRIDLQVLRTFKTDLPRIEKMLAETETSAWISHTGKEVIHKIDFESNTITKSRELSSQIYDMDFTANNDILFSDLKHSDVKLFSQSGKIQSFLSVKPLVPKAIHVTSDNDILVGVRETRVDGFQVSEKSQRAIFVFDMNGEQKHSYQYDKNGKRLFTVPTRIKTNKNKDILVIDGTSGNAGRVMCLERNGRLKFIYEGCKQINASKRFDPRDVTITSVGHIIVCDFSSHALHLLSWNGDLLFCKVTDELGILCPMAADIDCMGQLWIGCYKDIQKPRATIHIAKLLW